MGILVLILIVIAISLGVYALFIATATIVFKIIWFSAKIKQNVTFTQTNREGYPGKQKWYPTGWVFNEETQLWEPPDYLRPESKNKWKWDEKKKIWIDTEKERRLSRYKEYHKNKPPTFEEWKSLKEQESTSEEILNESSSTYSFKSSELPKDEVKIPPKQPEQRPTYEQSKQNQSKTTQSEYQGAYKAASILTENESQNYKVLKEAADRKGYTISVKMRLADLVTPTASRYDKSYMSYFGRIKAKHVDFVVFDQYMRPKAIIELDDSSHDRKDRQERDKFVDEILKDAGYKVIHTRYIWPDILDNV